MLFPFTTRRASLAVLACVLSAILTIGLVWKIELASADDLRIEGHLVRLPSHGTLYIASDFHGQLADFEHWLLRTDLEARLKNGEDVYGLILGDVVDLKPFHKTVPAPGDDVKILARIREIQQNSGKFGQRLICILGNHEQVAVSSYQWLTEHGLTDKNRSRLIHEMRKALPGHSSFHFINRMTEDHYEYLRQLPVAVLAKNGFCAVHGGPPKIVPSLNQIAQGDPRIVSELVWNRPAGFLADAPDESDDSAADSDSTALDKSEFYTEKDLGSFLTVMENSTLLVSGHTLVSSARPEHVRDGVGIFGDHQIILSTSIGALSKPEKSYLIIDLSKRYHGVGDVTLGREILRLYPASSSRIR